VTADSSGYEVLRRGSAANRLLGLWVRVPPWVSMSCLLHVLSGKGLCIEMITRLEESCGVSECDCEVSKMMRRWPNSGCCAMVGGGLGHELPFE
jgi:hypothetical protein